jgi:hypothetical protein
MPPCGALITADDTLVHALEEKYIKLRSFVVKVRLILLAPTVEVSYQSWGQTAVIVAGAWVLYADHGIASELQTQSGSLLLGWDTAAQANILKPTVLGLSQDQFKMGELRRVLGAIGTGERSSIPFRLVDTQVPGLDGLLGYDYFNSHVVCLDLPARRVRVKKVPV